MKNCYYRRHLQCCYCYYYRDDDDDAYNCIHVHMTVVMTLAYENDAAAAAAVEASLNAITDCYYHYNCSNMLSPQYYLPKHLLTPSQINFDFLLRKFSLTLTRDKTSSLSIEKSIFSNRCHWWQWWQKCGFRHLLKLSRRSLSLTTTFSTAIEFWNWMQTKKIIWILFE